MKKKLMLFFPLIFIGSPTFNMDYSKINYCYESYDQLKDDLSKNGYKANNLISKIKSNAEFPSIAKQTSLDWYPHNYFRKNGGYDGLATLCVTLLKLDGASDKNSAFEYCTHSVFMTSYREIVEKTFHFLDQCPHDLKICLPAGGIPYYIPTTKDITIYDTDNSLEEPLKKWPNCKAILGENGDVYKINGKFDIMCCIGFSFYLKSTNEFKNLIKVMHCNLNKDGILILNFILKNSGIDENMNEIPNFKKALHWNMGVIKGLNPNPIFTGLFLTREQVLNLCNESFELIEMFTGSLHVHGLAIFKKRS